MSEPKRYVAVKELTTDSEGNDTTYLFLTEGGEVFEIKDTLTLSDIISAEIKDLRTEIIELAIKTLTMERVESGVLSYTQIGNIGKLADSILDIFKKGEKE